MMASIDDEVTAAVGGHTFIIPLAACFCASNGIVSLKIDVTNHQ
jgi:hypothetical protein